MDHGRRVGTGEGDEGRPDGLPCGRRVVYTGGESPGGVCEFPFPTLY